MTAPALAPLSTPAGLLERMFLHETLTPEYADRYNRDQSLRAMRFMRQVLENRLKDAAHWGAPGARDIIPIVKAKGQFGQFALYPNLPAKFMSGVTGIVDNANSITYPKRVLFAEHIADAITAATEVVFKADIVAMRPLAWMKAGNSPGRRFRLLEVLQGNAFFAVD